MGVCNCLVVVLILMFVISNNDSVYAIQDEKCRKALAEAASNCLSKYPQEKCCDAFGEMQNNCDCSMNTSKEDCYTTYDDVET